MNSSPEERVTATVLLLAWYLNPNCQWLQCLTSPCDACTPCFSLHLMLDQLGQHLRPWWQEWEVTGLPGCQSGGSSTNPGSTFSVVHVPRGTWLGRAGDPAGVPVVQRASSGTALGGANSSPWSPDALNTSQRKAPWGNLRDISILWVSYNKTYVGFLIVEWI